MIERVISTILKGSMSEHVSLNVAYMRRSTKVVDLQTRFSCPVPTLRQTKRTIPEAIVSAPNAKVRPTPVEDLSIPFTKSTTGTA